MLKKQEIDNLQSCLNRAAMDEPVFVILGRDVTGRDTVRAWIHHRISAGKNKPGDKQITEASDLADAMGEYAKRRALEAHAETRKLSPATGWPFPSGARP